MLKSKRFNTAATIILTVLVIITLLPLALIVISSFTKESALIRNGYSFWPQEWSLDAYYYMIKQGAVILRSYGISVFVTVVGTAASVILTTMLAYPMSRKSFKYHNALSFFVFFTMLFNGGIVPSYIMWTKIFHIKDTIFYVELAKADCKAPDLFNNAVAQELSEKSVQSMMDFIRWANYLLSTAFSKLELTARQETISQKVHRYIKEHYAENIDRNSMVI